MSRTEKTPGEEPEKQPSSRLDDPLMSADPHASYDPTLFSDGRGARSDDPRDVDLPPNNSGDGSWETNLNAYVPETIDSDVCTDHAEHRKTPVDNANFETVDSIPITSGSNASNESDAAARGSKELDAVVPVHANDPSSRYSPTEMYARGGLGAVYRATDRELNRLVALKEILPEHSAKTQYQEKFI
ncbi:MAG: hypothetical protein KDB00_30170, partial [Planctomycetales bacterium]|nr:hypothetical protein [Planctomycetales bacterium]